MMRLRLYVAAALFAIPATVFTALPATALDADEGQWEYTTEMKMEGMPAFMPVMKNTSKVCITRNDAVPHSKEDKECVVKNQQISGNTVKWAVACNHKDGAKSEGTGEVTYTGKGMKGSINLTMKDKRGATTKVATKISGRYIGPCAGKK